MKLDSTLIKAREVDPVFLDTGLGENQQPRRTGRLIETEIGRRCPGWGPAATGPMFDGLKETADFGRWKEKGAA